MPTNKTLSIDKTQKVFQTLFTSSAEGFIIANKAGIIQMVNPASCTMFGYTEDELLGKSIEILVPKELKNKHLGYREKYMNAPKQRAMGRGMNLVAIKKDKTSLPVEISLNHITIDNELLVTALITDISERKKAEDDLYQLNAKLEEKVKERTFELQNSQELYKQIARNFPNGTINVFDKNLNYVFVEGQELYKLGITSEKLVGTNYLDRLNQSLRTEIKKKLLSCFNGRDTSFIVENDKNYYNLNAVGLKNESGIINQILVVEENITKQKLSEQNMQNALQKEKDLNELKSRFVSMASHEFRTPLSSILSSSDLIERYNIEQFKGENHLDKKLSHIKKIKASVRNLTVILDDFLSLDKLTEGKIQQNPNLLNVKETTDNLLEIMLDLKKQGQKITYQHSGKEQIYLDKKFYTNIINNLLSNAVKYSAKNTEINITTNVDELCFSLSISDQGIGISKGDQKHLFERFFRAENAVNLPGTGLGLNIVKKYVDLMNGKITFTSKINIGTTFTISIPLINEEDIDN